MWWDWEKWIMSGVVEGSETRERERGNGGEKKAKMGQKEEEEQVTQSEDREKDERVKEETMRAKRKMSLTGRHSWKLAIPETSAAAAERFGRK